MIGESTKQLADCQIAVTAFHSPMDLSPQCVCSRKERGENVMASYLTLNLHFIVAADSLIR